MLFQERSQPAPQLAGAVTVNDAHHLLIADGGLVEKLLDARDRLVDGTANDVHLRVRTLAWLEIDADLDRCRRVFRLPGPADRVQIAKWRTQPLSLHVDFRVLAVHLDHDAFEAEGADGN